MLAKLKSWSGWNKLVSWWAYSRTVFLNVGSAIVMVLNELLPSLMGIDYDAFVKHEVSVAIGIGLNLLNVWLRMITVAPVGASANAKVAAVNAVADVHEEEVKLAVEEVAQSPKAD